MLKEYYNCQDAKNGIILRARRPWRPGALAVKSSAGMVVNDAPPAVTFLQNQSEEAG